MQDSEARDTARSTVHRSILHHRKTSKSFVSSANVNCSGEEEKGEATKPWDIPTMRVGGNAPDYFYNLRCVFSVFSQCPHLPSPYIT